MYLNLICLGIWLIFARVSIVHPKNDTSITTKIISLKCEHVDPSIYDGIVNCSIKTSRNGRAVTNVRYFYGKPVFDLWVQIKVYYRFPTSTQFRPWMIDLEVDICKTTAKLAQFKGFAFFLASSLMKNTPGLIHPCPYLGDEGLKDADISVIVSDAIPQIIPKGLYKLLLRFHLKNNQTFLNVYVTVHIDAKDPLKAFDMGK